MLPWPWDLTYFWIENFLITFSFDILLKYFIISHNVFILRERALIFGICVSYDKVFPMIPIILNINNNNNTLFKEGNTFSL